jgi:hypothetical protein
VVNEHACIAIGINQYERLQPLSYAQRDAQAFIHFLVTEARLPADRCVLLNDTSVPMGEHSTAPNRENILAWLDRMGQEYLNPNNLLWFFFSGYGASWNGQDYLMPADGDPTDVPKTGIAMRELYTKLKRLPAQRVVVLLDMNRAFGMRAGEEIGLETIELAKRLEIPTILSCQPGQFSREVGALRHGLFTTALLEGFRYNRCINLGSLEQYLKVRLPELCDHHWVPVQEPMIVVHPEEVRDEIMWPLKDLVVPNSTNAYHESPVPKPYYLMPAKNNREPISNGKVSENLDHPVPVREEIIPPVPVPEEIIPPVPVQQPEPEAQWDSEDPSDNLEVVLPASLKSQLWLLVAGAVVLGLLGGFGIAQVFDKNKPVSPPLLTQDNSESASEIEAETPEAGTPATATPTSPQQQQANQKVLEQAVLAVEPVSASQFRAAIATASQIPNNDPLYEQAQKNIDRWSNVILDIAQARAKQGKLSAAIEAAKLIPTDRPRLKAEAQLLIDQWQGSLQKQQNNQKLLQQAAASIRPGVLPSYQQAIQLASQISAGQPQYQEAQRFIDRASRAVYYQIALYRAQRGQFSGAIEAAGLIPENTSVYATAQKSIVEWKKRVN